ncbi:MAG: helix-turn-helix transcriptional regulator [Candidatus Omnitrophota bacterium]
MSNNWLWDTKLTESEVKKILKDPKHRRFAIITSMLLLRNNEPKIIFKNYLDTLLFCKSWPKIKKQMNKDKWGSQRIIFWQAIFENLRNKYQKKGVSLRQKGEKVRDDICKEVGCQIREIRQEKGISQKALADKLDISQQIISHIEKGYGNISLITLKKIFQVLGKNISLKF